MPNLVTLLLGWDGLGLVSFLLVIYYQNPRSLGAGIITLITNRIGDALIILSIAILVFQGHWNLFNFWSSPFNPYIAFIVIIAATTKRAQIPFSRWLPAAIAAPTPVSALVHSSTLVTAGVYLLIRFFPFLAASPRSLILLLVSSTATTIIAGLAAIIENDIKKIIALSTLRQLGIIIIRLSLGSPTFTFFHLITHAIFKALLFICAGTIIHLHNNNQDLRLFGSLNSKIPLTSAAITVANCSLIGIPFLAGFYSKDLIIELTMTSNFNLVIFVLTLISTALTAAYSLRFSYYTSWAHQLSSSTSSPSDNSSSQSTKAILLLTSGAIAGGATLNWLVIFPSHSLPITTEIKLIPLIIVILALVFMSPAYLIVLLNKTTHFIPLNNFLSSIWFLTPSVSYWPNFYTSKTSPLAATCLDQGWNETAGAQGTSILSSLAQNIILIRQSLFLTRVIIILAPLILLAVLLFT